MAKEDSVFCHFMLHGFGIVIMQCHTMLLTRTAVPDGQGGRRQRDERYGTQSSISWTKCLMTLDARQYLMAKEDGARDERWFRYCNNAVSYNAAYTHGAVPDGQGGRRERAPRAPRPRHPLRPGAYTVLYCAVLYCTVLYYFILSSHR